MAGEMWSSELTDWQRASFCVKENSPPSKLDALRMKLAQLELECLKNSSKGLLPSASNLLTEHLKEYRKCLLQCLSASNVTGNVAAPTGLTNTKGWSSGLKLDDVLHLNAVKRYKEVAEVDSKKFKPQVSNNFNTSNTVDSSSYRKPIVVPKHQPLFASSKPQWKSRPQRKRHRSSNSNDDDETDDDTPVQARKDSNLGFVTAKDQFIINQHKKGCGQYDQTTTRHAFTSNDYGGTKKSLGARRNVGNRFIPPIKGDDQDDGRMGAMGVGTSNGNGTNSAGSRLPPELEGDERLKNIEPRMVEMIMNEIMDHGAPVQWDDIAGLQFAKNTIKEIVIYPMLRPDIFTGLRGPPKGILLFGPPGTGKTLIGKCIASQAGATFFSISASSLTSKWIGEGEKMVRALFAVAQCYDPAVIFIDEIDSLLSQRSDTEHEASRRMKTEFLIKLDGVTATNSERILLVGATNRPQEIDEAARRRLVKRLYIPLPDIPARRQIVTNLMKQQVHNLTDEQFDQISEQTDGYSGADVASLCSEAAMGPIRNMSIDEIRHISSDEVRPVRYEDFVEALEVVRPSVSFQDLKVYEEWNKLYGCGR